MNGRSSDARRFRDLVELFADDLGGFAGLSEPNKALIRQAASLSLEAERMQAASVRGEPVDHDSMIRLTNTLRRVLASLGGRVPQRAAEHDLAAYLASRRPAA